MFKNWKSTMSFFIFVGLYVYSLVTPLSDNIVDTAGYIALISSILMMLRSELTSDIISRLVDNIRVGK